MNFNKAQLGAIEHKDGAMLVLAGPGSGKTAVITHRTKNLITKHHVKPSEILVITFTKAAANEMKERFNSLMKDERVNVSFGTFHISRYLTLQINLPGSHIAKNRSSSAYSYSGFFQICAVW